MAALNRIRQVIARSGNLKTAAILSSVYLYARLQSGDGIPRGGGVEPDRGRKQRQMSIRTWLAGTGLARRAMDFKMRDGSQMRSRIVDSGALLSIHVDRDYDVPR